MTWLRWYEGTCHDGKFQVVATRAEVSVATVIALWAMLLEDAAHEEHRGVAVKGCKFYSFILSIPEETIERVLLQMAVAHLIEHRNDQIAIVNWDKRQFTSDLRNEKKPAAQKSREWRERKRTQANVTERPEQNRTDKDGRANAPSPDPERDLFERGKQILGPRSGGLIARLLKLKRGDVALARAAIEVASTKQDPTEYLGAIVAGHKGQSANDLFYGSRTPGIV